MFFVYGCLKCHRPASLRIVESRTSFRPKVFKCFICGKTRRVFKERALCSSNDYSEVKGFLRKYKLVLIRREGG